MDRFNIDGEDLDLENLIAIRVRHDNSGDKPEWYLDRVEILESDTKNKFIFSCNKWFAKTKFDSKIDRIIEEKVRFTLIIE